VKYLAALLAGVALVGTAAYSGPEAQAPVSITSQAGTAPSAEPTTPPVATPATLTREQAGQLYLKLAKPANAIFDEPKCSQAEDFFINGGSWPPADTNWDDRADRVLRSCHKRLVPLFEKNIKAFQTTLWPADAQADVADLVSLDQAFLHCLKLSVRGTSSDEMYKALECFPADDGSADRVRARFGLPRRSPS
jgi:hypothetical protein